MARVNLINKESLPKLLESITESVVKAFDELDLFKYDGLISSFPFGKVVSYVVRKIVQISDVEKALQQSISTSAFITYFHALRSFDINPVVDEVFLVEKITEIKKANEKKKFGYLNFDLNSFSKNTITKHYQKLLNEFSDNLLNENDAARIKKYLRDYHKKNFLKLLEDNEMLFKKLSEYFGRESTDEIIIGYKKEEYREMICQGYSEIILNDPKGLKLSDIYIEPEYNIHINCLNDKLSKQLGKKKEDEKGFIKYNKHSIHDFSFAFLKGKVDKSFKHSNSNVLFILGYPGQGKSSFCKKLIYDSIKGEKIIDKDIYLVKFRNITNTSDLIYSPINSLHAFLNSQLEFEVSRQDFKNSILILDGLDELFMKENLQYSGIDEFCRLIIRETESNDYPKIIITSRYGYVNTERFKTENAIVVQLREFDLGRQKQWLNVYTRFHPETLLSINKLIEINTKSEYKYLSELISQPILLHLLSSLQEEIDIRTNRAKIYENLFTQLIQRNWAKEGQIDNLAGLTQSDLRDFLREIAFAIFRSGKEYINKDALVALDTTKDFLDKMLNKQFQDSFKRLMIAFYFQEVKKDDKDGGSIDKNDYAIEFLHKSLQEYLVAEKVWNSMIVFLDKNSRTGRYTIDEDKHAFEVIDQLFSQRLLTKEISEYIIEIVSNDILVEKNELFSRLVKFFASFLESDFISKDESFKGMSPLAISCNNFFGFWLIFSCIKEKKNYIPQEQRKKFAMFLRLFTGENPGLDLSYQDFSGAYLEGVNLAESNLSHSIFKNCSLSGSDFTGSDLTHTDFSKAELYRATFERAKISHTNFSNASLISAVLYNLKLQSAVFKDANLKGTVFTESDLKGIDFENCNLEYTNFLGTKNQSYSQFEHVLSFENNCSGINPEILKKLI